MMGDYASLTLDQINVGDTLPELPYDVTATTVVFGAIATRDIRPMHHDRDFAQKRNGVKDIFLNTPNLAHWFERYVTDWTGPLGRPGRMKFRMQGSVFAGEHMVFKGKVEEVGTDDTGCGWVSIQVQVDVEGETKTSCQARFAVPTSPNDNPWKRKGNAWQP
jgi:acyl dehydratase